MVGTLPKIGSDHFPIMINLQINSSGTNNNPITDNETPLIFKNLDWNKFVNKCEQVLSDTLVDESLEIFYEKSMACLKEITQDCVKPKKNSKHKPSYPLVDERMLNSNKN